MKSPSGHRVLLRNILWNESKEKYKNNRHLCYNYESNFNHTMSSHGTIQHEIIFKLIPFSKVRHLLFFLRLQYNKN